MKSLLYNLFIEHWPRKLVSILLAVMIWLVVNRTITSTHSIRNVPVRIMHIPPGKTVEGIQTNGRLTKGMTVTLAGNKELVDKLSSADLEVLVDATNQPDEWTIT